jgi:hypothetical protein
MTAAAGPAPPTNLGNETVAAGCSAKHHRHPPLLPKHARQWSDVRRRKLPDTDTDTAADCDFVTAGGQIERGEQGQHPRSSNTRLLTCCIGAVVDGAVW